MPGNSDLTGEQLANGFAVKQYSDETFTTEAADGNYFTFTTSPSRVVTIYQLDAEGNRNDLASGKANGTFKIVPKRGNPTTQTYYIETRDFNGNVITGSKTAEVFVPSELSPEMRLLASDSYGSKVWNGILNSVEMVLFGVTLVMPLVMTGQAESGGALSLKNLQASCNTLIPVSPQVKRVQQPQC